MAVSQSRQRGKGRFAPGILLAVICLSVTSGLRAQNKPSQTVAPLEELVSRVETVLEALDSNVEMQSLAWPQRERDQENELPPPPRVRKLQSDWLTLEDERSELVQAADKAAENGISPVLRALSKTDDEFLIRSLAPIVQHHGTDHPSTLRVFSKLARKLDPCPQDVVDVLVSLNSREANTFLLELGKARKNGLLLQASARKGDHVILRELIALAEKKDELALASLRRLSRPEKISARLMLEVSSAAEVSSSVDVRVVLLTYLGVLRDNSSFRLLQRTYEKSEGIERLAALGALGRLDSAAYLLEELEKKSLTRAERHSCIAALGQAKHRPAVPKLIEMLSIRRNRYIAARALSHIAGRDLGDKRAAWLLWYSQQADDDSTAPDKRT